MKATDRRILSLQDPRKFRSEEYSLRNFDGAIYVDGYVSLVSLRDCLRLIERLVAEKAGTNGNSISFHDVLIDASGNDIDVSLHDSGAVAVMIRAVIEGPIPDYEPPWHEAFDDPAFGDFE